MKRFLVLLLTTFLLASLAAIALQAAGADAKKPPEQLVFKTKMGNVTFHHAEHIKRVDGKCAVCHDKLFKQDATAPLGFKKGMHKPAEASKTSCGACHHQGGKAFPTKGNCKKCHVK